MRNPWFCVAAYLLSKQTASEPSDSTPSKPVSNARINPKGCQSKRSSHKEGRGPPKGCGGVPADLKSTLSTKPGIACKEAWHCKIDPSSTNQWLYLKNQVCWSTAEDSS